jgi:two-component system, sensor histidine kinase and response regulator
LQGEYALTIQQSASALLAIINDILDFSKIEAGKLQLEYLDMSLCGVVDDVAKLLATQAHAKGLELIAVLDPSLPELVSGDAGRLRQILLNLVGNAVKFTHSGEVSIECSVLAGTEHSTLVRYEIRDTGIGIPADRLDALFQAFTQVDATTTRRFGGTGLGLSIVKHLVQLMDGDVGVESQEGAGSTFWFTARFKPAEAAKAHPMAARFEFHGQRVLVVDDSETNRRMLTRTLASCRLEVACARSSEEALSLLRYGAASSRPFDAVIIDQHMPGCDGLQLHGTIRDEPQLRGTRTILLTPPTQRRDDKWFSDLELAGYVAKPVKQSSLLQCLASTLGVMTETSTTSTPATPKLLHAALPYPSQRILLAEDNVVNQKVAYRLVEKLGYRVDVVADGRAAFDAWRSGGYDLILMDCQMPRVDGLQATRLIRAAETADQHIPIVALTAHAMKGTDNECLSAGMDYYLSKPIDRELLRECLERYLRSHRSNEIPGAVNLRTA